MIHGIIDHITDRTIVHGMDHLGDGVEAIGVTHITMADTGGIQTIMEAIGVEAIIPHDQQHIAILDVLRAEDTIMEEATTILLADLLDLEVLTTHQVDRREAIMEVIRQVGLLVDHQTLTRQVEHHLLVQVVPIHLVDHLLDQVVTIQQQDHLQDRLILTHLVDHLLDRVVIIQQQDRHHLDRQILIRQVDRLLDQVATIQPLDLVQVLTEEVVL